MDEYERLCNDISDDLKQIKYHVSAIPAIEVRLGAVEKHLEKQNGRIYAGEKERSDFATRLAVVSALQGVANKASDKLEGRIWEFVKDKGISLGAIGGIVYVIIEISKIRQALP